MHRVFRYVAGVVVGMLVMASTAWSKDYPKAQLQKDFKQLQTIVMSKHPKLYDNDGKLAKAFNEQFKAIKDDMSELEFYRLLTPLIAKVGCGHTNLTVSEDMEEYLAKNGRYLPLDVRIIDNRIYVVKDFSEEGIPKGSELLAINGRSSGDIVQGLLDYLTSDGYNKTKKYYIMNHWFNGVFYYYIDSSQEFRLEYRVPGGREPVFSTVQSKHIAQMSMTAMNIYFRKRNMFPKTEIRKDYAVLTVPIFQLRNKKQYTQQMDVFFAELASRKVKNLVLDLRGNWGGLPFYSSYLFSYLIDSPKPYFSKSAPFIFWAYKKPVKPKDNRFKGNLYVLTDGADFSTAAHLCALLRYHKIGTFIGDETGGGAVCTDGSIGKTLKFTKLRLNCATMAFGVAVSGLPKGRGIQPDIEVRPVLNDYLEGRDVEMAKAMELIGN